MAHMLVEQLRFTRSDWLRGLKDVDAEGSAPAPRPHQLNQLDDRSSGLA